MRRRDVSESARNPEHRPGAPKSPITHNLILDSAPLPGHFKYQHGCRHRHVEALGRTSVRDRDPLVDRGISARPCASLPTTTATRPWYTGSVYTSPRCEEVPSRESRQRVERGFDDGNTEDRTGARPDDLGVVRIDRPSVNTTPFTPLLPRNG
jgi:hypothetical protein